MSKSAYLVHCVRIPESQLRRTNGDDRYLHEQSSGSSGKQSATHSAAWNALVYLREKKNRASLRSIQFFEDAIDNLTDSQRQELHTIIQAKPEAPHCQSNHQNLRLGNDANGGFHEPDVKTVMAGLCILSSDQLDWLSITIAPQLERYLKAERFDNQIRTGAYAHRLIEKRKKARGGQRTRLRANGPYETVMENAMGLFGCSSSDLRQAYGEFKWMRSARMVDERGRFVQIKSKDGDIGDGQLS